jgi:VWFA-related protein
MLALVACASASAPVLFAAGQATFRSSVDIVYVNVIVRDQAGQPVRGLKPEDFIVTEDGKPQAVSTFAYEEVGKNVNSVADAGAGAAGLLQGAAAASTAAAKAATAPGAARGAASGSASGTAPAPASAAAATAASAPAVEVMPQDLHGRRLIVLFFDLSAMQPEEIGRAATSAQVFVNTKLEPTDLVAVVQLSTNLNVIQDFTVDRTKVQTILARFDPNASNGFDTGTTADDADPTDVGAEYVPDESEFNIFNTDRRLDALGQVASALSVIEQRKSIVYFSGGMTRTDQDNQVLLRRTIDRAVRANVAIYTMDTRGLQAFVPGGEAQQASARGTGAFSGANMRSRADSQVASQEALSALAKDTGGQAVFDTNDFGKVFDRVLSDTEAYYVIGYSSTNPARDGKFRRIKVQTRNGSYRIEHRSGYYAPRDYAHSSRADREQQLEDQLASDLSVTDLPVYLSTAYFRLSASRYSVPVSVAVPGSKVPFARAGDNKSRATLDLLGAVTDEQKRVVARVRDTVRLQVDDPNPSARNIQYQTTLELPPGKYRMKVAVRENEQGTMGAFEHDVVIPALDKLARDATVAAKDAAAANGAGKDGGGKDGTAAGVAPLKASSVVLGTRLGLAAEERGQTSPLATLAEGLVPNVAPVVSARQRVYVYFEVYDPQGAAAGAGARPAGADDEVHVMASLSFLRKGVRVYQTPVVSVTRLSAPDRKAAAFRLEVPPTSLAPGLYTCQVNIIDDAAGAFAFPRMQLLVRP